MFVTVSDPVWNYRAVDHFLILLFSTSSLIDFSQSAVFFDLSLQVHHFTTHFYKAWHLVVFCFSWFQEDRCNWPNSSTNISSVEGFWFVWSANSRGIWWLRFECYRICSFGWGHINRWVNCSNISSTSSNWTEGMI